MTVLSFVRAQAGFLAFGCLCMMVSNFGQTYFLALYADALRQRFDLSLSDFGLLYSSVTLLSAICLLWVGRLIDRQPLVVFTMMVFTGLTVACLVMATASHISLCILALFLLRLFGQGLASHTGMTSISRAYHAHRGTAVSISLLGYPLGESLLPAVVVVLLLVLDWQHSWFLFAAFIGLIALPLLIFLARFEPRFDLGPEAGLPPERAVGSAVGQTVGRTVGRTVGEAGAVAPREKNVEGQFGDDPEDKGTDDSSDNRTSDAHTQAPVVAADRMHVLRDSRFYGVLPLYLASPFLLTGMFLNQLTLADVKGWSTTDLAAAFTFYAAIKMIVSLLTGRLVDRFSARKLLAYTAVPLIAAFGVIAYDVGLPAGITVYLYLALVGVNLGMGSPISGGLWPELYGTKYLGAIRSMTTPFVIFSTSLAPLLFGFVLDAGVGFASIAEAAMVYLLLAACLAEWVLHNKRL